MVSMWIRVLGFHKVKRPLHEPLQPSAPWSRAQCCRHCTIVSSRIHHLFLLVKASHAGHNCGVKKILVNFCQASFLQPTPSKTVGLVPPLPPETLIIIVINVGVREVTKYDLRESPWMNIWSTKSHSMKIFSNLSGATYSPCANSVEPTVFLDDGVDAAVDVVPEQVWKYFSFYLWCGFCRLVVHLCHLRKKSPSKGDDGGVIGGNRWYLSRTIHLWSLSWCFRRHHSNRWSSFSFSHKSHLQHHQHQHHHYHHITKHTTWVWNIIYGVSHFRHVYQLHLNSLVHIIIAKIKYQ